MATLKIYTKVFRSVPCAVCRGEECEEIDEWEVVRENLQDWSAEELAEVCDDNGGWNNDDTEWIPAPLVNTVAAMLNGFRTSFYAVDFSDSPSDGVGGWFLNQPYEHPHTGDREEMTAHLEGFTDEEQRRIYRLVFPKKS